MIVSPVVVAVVQQVPELVIAHVPLPMLMVRVLELLLSNVGALSPLLPMVIVPAAWVMAESHVTPPSE